MLPTLVRPWPLVKAAAPANCEKAIAVEPNCIGPRLVVSLVQTQAESLYVVPSSTNVNVPPVSSVLSSVSVALYKYHCEDPEPTEPT